MIILDPRKQVLNSFSPFFFCFDCFMFLEVLRFERTWPRKCTPMIEMDAFWDLWAPGTSVAFDGTPGDPLGTPGMA